jgi:hypothetical protein
MRASKWFLVLAIPMICVTAARPDEQIVPEGSTVPLLLLRQKSVQDELKLGDDVTKKIADFTNKQYEAFTAALKLGAAERKQKLESMEQENKKFIAESLTEQQLKRLDQITLQITALQQLTRPEIAKELNLTDDQTKKIKELQKEAREELAKLLDNKNANERREKFAAARMAIREKVRGLMTDEQKAKIDVMVGEPFNGEIVFEGAEPGN